VKVYKSVNGKNKGAKKHVPLGPCAGGTICLIPGAALCILPGARSGIGRLKSWPGGGLTPFGRCWGGYPGGCVGGLIPLLGVPGGLSGG